jgi:hypothetical protein
MEGWPAVERAGRLFNTLTVKDAFGRPVLLFKNKVPFLVIKCFLQLCLKGEGAGGRG